MLNHYNAVMEHNSDSKGKVTEERERYPQKKSEIQLGFKPRPFQMLAFSPKSKYGFLPT